MVIAWKVLKTAALGAAALLVTGAALADDTDEGPRTFTSADIFNLEYATSPRVSPDASTIVYVRMGMDIMTDRRVGALWTLDIASGAHRPLVTGEGSVSGPRWSPSGDRLLYTAAAAAGENGAELRVRFIDDGSTVSLAQLPSAPMTPSWSPDGTQIAFAMHVKADAPSFASPPAKPEGADWAKPVRVFDMLPFRYDGAGYLTPGATQIHVVPAEGGSPRALTSGDVNYTSPDWIDAETLVASGDAGAQIIADPVESTLVRIDVADGAITPLTDRDGPDYAPLVSPDGAQIAYFGADEVIQSHVQSEVSVVAVDGGEARTITSDLDRRVFAAQWRPDGSDVLVLHDDRGDVVLAAVGLDGAITELSRQVGGTSIGRPYAAGQFHAAGDVIAFTLVSADRPSDIAVLNADGSARQLTDLNADALGHVELAAIEMIEATSPVDDTPIQAWVALPPGFEADGTAPMVMEIHGGPHLMYGPSFAAEIQRFAAEGYVAVYANPRGSTGYGAAFAQAINLAYPGEDYDDLMAVVDALVAQNYVDPDRLFVTGGSGGGILTAWIVGKTDRFAAAASIKPVINWTTMALAADVAHYFTPYWMQALPWEDPEGYWARSPLSLMGNVTTPTLMMVGEEDWRTPTWEAEQFYTALKLQGVDTALVRVPGAAHSIANRPSQMIAKVDTILGWFAKYDPKADDDPAEDNRN